MSVRTSDRPRTGEGENLPSFQPRTSLGKRLWEIRAQIMATGEQPLGWDDIENEIAEQRHDRGLKK